jgi:ATP-dependent DNA ligase
MYELKWDGFRCALVRDGTVTRLWSRQGKDLTDHFPDVARAATGQVPSGTWVERQTTRRRPQEQQRPPGIRG